MVSKRKLKLGKIGDRKQSVDFKGEKTLGKKPIFLEQQRKNKN